MFQTNGIQLKWLGHDTFRISYENKNIYIDPFRVSATAYDANIVLISHNHYDHLSIEDLNKVINENTIIVCGEECIESLKNINVKDTIIVHPDDKIEVMGMLIEAVNSYNINKSFHPKSATRVGFIITINNTRIYHAGDTDLIPEMKSIKPDIALLPVSGTYVMNADEAALAVNEYLKPKINAIPMHYGAIVGSIEDAKRFKESVKVCDVVLLEKQVD